MSINYDLSAEADNDMRNSTKTYSCCFLTVFNISVFKVERDITQEPSGFVYDINELKNLCFVVILTMKVADIFHDTKVTYSAVIVENIRFCF